MDASTIERNVLTVKGERRFASQAGDEVVVSERPQGMFTRQLFLGDTLDGEHISASYHDGVLTLHIPVAEQAEPRRIQISSDGEPQSVDTDGGSQGRRETAAGVA